jgi:hypothetical protein
MVILMGFIPFCLACLSFSNVLTLVFCADHMKVSATDIACFLAERKKLLFERMLVMGKKELVRVLGKNNLLLQLG